MEFVKVAEKDGALVLADANGNKALFDFLDMLVLDEIEYAALLQIDTDDLIILRFEEQQDGREVYFAIDDDETFDKVACLFEEIFNED